MFLVKEFHTFKFNVSKFLIIQDLEGLKRLPTKFEDALHKVIYPHASELPWPLTCWPSIDMHHLFINVYVATKFEACEVLLGIGVTV